MTGQYGSDKKDGSDGKHIAAVVISTSSMLGLAGEQSGAGSFPPQENQALSGATYLLVRSVLSYKAT